MTIFVALLRAVNVGGTGKLPMSELKSLCAGAGFKNARTYIASGNVLFESDRREGAVKAKLERALQSFMEKPVGVIVRTAAEMADVAAKNPFAGKPGNRTVVIFLDRAPPGDFLANVKGQAGEKIVSARREIFVWYPDGIAKSKLRIPAADGGTARNMNTVAKLAALASEMSGQMTSAG